MMIEDASWHEATSDVNQAETSRLKQSARE